MSCGINPGSHCIGPRGWTTLHVGKIRFPRLRKWRANVGVERERPSMEWGSFVKAKTIVRKSFFDETRQGETHVSPRSIK